jgi:4-amino-4-deoxy-L-arabinose transferase-like glycosyltransferase
LSVRSSALALLAALATAAAFAWVLHARAVVPAGPMNWDEGYHALHGLRIAEELREGSLLRLAYDSYRSVYWPPLHAWYLALFFLVFGVTAEIARDSSLVALVASAGALALAGRRADGPAAGLVAALAFLLSPMVATLSSQVLLELPGLALLLASVALYAGGRSRVLLGLSIFATFLTRANYGVLLALAVTAAFAVDGAWGRRLPPGDPRRAIRRGQARTALALAVPLALWFAYLPKVAHTLAALVNLPLGPSRFSADGLLFYPRAAVRLAGSWPLAALWLAALVLSLRPGVLRSDRTVRLLVALATLQILFAELSATKLDRHILPLAGALSLLVGIQAARLFANRGIPVRILLLALGSILFAVQGAAVLRSAAPAAARGPEALVPRLAAEMRRGGRAALVAPSDAALPPATCDFELVAAGVLPLDGAGSLRTVSELAVASSWPAPAGARWPGRGPYSAYIGLPRGEDTFRWTPANFTERFGAVLQAAPPDRVVAITGGEGVFPEVTPAFFTSALSGLGFSPESSMPAEQGTTLLTFRRVVPSSAPLSP